MILFSSPLDFLVCGIWVLGMQDVCVGIAAGGLFGATLETSLPWQVLCCLQRGTRYPAVYVINHAGFVHVGLVSLTLLARS